jgi:two-component system, NtrC family, nitrogen regulation sensor histidine kinase NtrY
MSFQTRLFIAFGAAVLVPLGVLALGVRREMAGRLTAENARRADAAVSALRDELSRESADIAARLGTLASQLAGDNRFRLGVVNGDAQSRRSLLDLAGGAMRAAGLSLLQVQDSAGRIVSSGHFRNEFDRAEPELPRALAAEGDRPVLVRARTPDSSLVALARVDSLRVAGRWFTLVGGTAIEGRLRAQLARDPELSLRLVYPRGPAAPAIRGSVVSELALPFLDLLPTAGASLDTARVIVTQSGATLSALRRSLDVWFLAALGVTLALALGLAAWLSSRISRPLTSLAEQTAAIDFDRLDQRFASDRGDEIGALAGVLDAMTARLRQGAARLRDAERRIATGDLARQVNHDIKNGLVPIRNVLRHLAQVARDDPGSLARVFEERRGTLDSSLQYLDTLARNYARLSPAARSETCDVNAVVEEVIRGVPSAHGEVAAELAPALPPVLADPLVLRRILENLVGNAVDSLSGDGGGAVRVGTERLDLPAGALVRVTVGDTGPGMTRAGLERAFEDFSTTKEGGTGLGLSIVRRLVLDLGGTLRIETAPGAGTRAIVELPAHAAPGGDGRAT